MKYEKLYIQKMRGSKTAYETVADFGIYCREFPFAYNWEAKDLYSNNWYDEDGDEEFIPPTLKVKSYNLTATFVAKGDITTIRENIEKFLKFLLGYNNSGALFFAWDNNYYTNSATPLVGDDVYTPNGQGGLRKEYEVYSVHDDMIDIVGIGEGEQEILEDLSRTPSFDFMDEDCPQFKIYDAYTRIGRRDVRFVKALDEIKFDRYDARINGVLTNVGCVEFKVEFKVNDPISLFRPAEYNHDYNNNYNIGLNTD